MADTVAGPAEELRQRVRGWRAAEEREHVLRSREGAMEASAALDAADELYEFCRSAMAGPDAIRDREVAGVRAAWRTLRARLACRPAAARHR